MYHLVTMVVGCIVQPNTELPKFPHLE